MKCPYCSFEESKVIDSRSSDDGEKIRRRRECSKCGRRFTTHEIIEIVPIIVVKRDLSRESFDKNKLLSGILTACQKRPIPLETVEGIANSIENKIESELSRSNEREISSQYIGELAMNALRSVDEVAYVRFASVYKQFKDINTFMEELNKILSENNSAHR